MIHSIKRLERTSIDAIASERISGKKRSDTVIVSSKKGWKVVFIGLGDNFPDALTGSVLVMKQTTYIAYESTYIASDEQYPDVLMVAAKWSPPVILFKFNAIPISLKPLLT